MTRPTTRMTRLPQKGSHDREALDALLDTEYVGHLGLVRDGHPVVIPTGIARDGDRVLLHGSTASGWMRQLAVGVDACLTVTSLRGIVVARSAFESSMHYRSAVLFGPLDPLIGDDKERALDVLIDKLIPGRREEVRPSTAKELAATLVLALPIERWSLRVSEGWPEDEPADVEGDAWAGVVPLRLTAGTPLRAPDLPDGIGLPASVRALSSNR